MEDSEDCVLRCRHAQVGVGLEEDDHPSGSANCGKCQDDQQWHYHPRYKRVESLAENIKPTHANSHEYESWRNEIRKDNGSHLPVVGELGLANNVLDACRELAGLVHSFFHVDQIPLNEIVELDHGIVGIFSYRSYHIFSVGTWFQRTNIALEEIHKLVTNRCGLRRHNLKGGHDLLNFPLNDLDIVVRHVYGIRKTLHFGQTLGDENNRRNDHHPCADAECHPSENTPFALFPVGKSGQHSYVLWTQALQDKNCNSPEDKHGTNERSNKEQSQEIIIRATAQQLAKITGMAKTRQ
mmetsp:Transcript_15997/g.40129  ORF Transcript_15997/g.40129 Transcript_15997/m.40129 type:complete len:296 (-) Transcript_15997:532-1419(-)